MRSLLSGSQSLFRLWIAATLVWSGLAGGREHRVPLSRSRSSATPPSCDDQAEQFLFPRNKAGRPLSNTALLMLLRRMGRDDLTSIASDRLPANGPPSKHISQAKSLRWRWRTRSGTRSKPHTGVATYSISGAD